MGCEISCNIPWEGNIGSAKSVVTASDCFAQDGEDASDLLPFMNEEGIIDEEDDDEYEDEDEAEPFDAVDEELSANPEDPQETGLLERQVTPLLLGQPSWW